MRDLNKAAMTDQNEICELDIDELNAVSGGAPASPNSTQPHFDKVILHVRKAGAEHVE